MRNIQDRQAHKIDAILDRYEAENGILQLRESLVRQAQGVVLETAVGTSRNLPYYAHDVKLFAADWSPVLLDIANLKYNMGLHVRYFEMDSEKLQFRDNSFDCVVDTFGLEAYLHPERALQEMQRVCKKGGKILLLTSGLSPYDYMNWMIELETPKFVMKNGYFPNRKWKEYITNRDFTIEKFERHLNGTLYMYILRNDKKPG